MHYLVFPCLLCFLFSCLGEPCPYEKLLSRGMSNGTLREGSGRSHLSILLLMALSLYMGRCVHVTEGRGEVKCAKWCLPTPILLCSVFEGQNWQLWPQSLSSLIGLQQCIRVKVVSELDLPSGFQSHKPVIRAGNLDSSSLLPHPSPTPMGALGAGQMQEVGKDTW